MRINRGFLGWGVFLLLAGAVPLAVRAGYLTTDQVRSVWSLWPLILIGIGIGLLLARTRLAFLGGVVVAATFGVMVGGLLSGGAEGFAGSACGSRAGATDFPARDGSFGSAPASVDIELNCGNVDVTVTSGSTWRVEGTSADGAGPTVDSDEDSLSVQSLDNDRGPLGIFDERETWRVSLPDATRFDLDLAVNAGSSSIDLDGAAVGVLSVDLNAGSTTIDLGAAREIEDLQIAVNAGSLGVTLPNMSVRGAIDANAGSVSLCVPPGAALRFHTDERIVAGYDYEDHGLVKNGSTWTTPGFDTAVVRIELDTRANAGSFSLDPEDGCDG